jgi:biopolymer transport protein ExbD
MHRSRRPQLSSSADDASINLTPLIDVVFVVLIIFILIAPMLELDRIQLAASAHKESKDVRENSPIAIYVHADNTIWFRNKSVNAKELSLLLKDAYQKSPNHVPQLFSDRKAYFESYQSVKNAIELAGFEQLDVILQPGQ